MSTTASEIDPAAQADIDKFEVQLARHLAGDLDDDAFRVFRLNNGIYGQRLGGHREACGDAVRNVQGCAT